MSTDRFVPVLQNTDVCFMDEARSIQRSARVHSARVVRLRQIVFFSTHSGDAWILDPEDGSASCLARDGEFLAIPIRETPTELAIEWQADYRIEGHAFIVVDRASGSARTIQGYPVKEIEKIVHAPATEPGLPAAQERRADG